MSSLFEFPLPDIGEGVAEGEVVEWKVKEGDAVQEDQVLLEVMTDKATVEISSPVRGTMRELVVKAGEVTPVGSVLCRIEPAAGAHVPTIVAHGDGHAKPAAKAAAAAPQQSEVPTSELPAVMEFTRPAGQRALATPFTRRLARELGLDIEMIEGTGDAGRVTEHDVRNFANAAKGAAATTADLPAPVPVPAAARAPSLSEQISASVQADSARRPAAGPAGPPVARRGSRRRAPRTPSD